MIQGFGDCVSNTKLILNRTSVGVKIAMLSVTDSPPMLFRGRSMVTASACSRNHSGKGFFGAVDAILFSPKRASSCSTTPTRFSPLAAN